MLRTGLIALGLAALPVAFWLGRPLTIELPPVPSEIRPAETVGDPIPWESATVALVEKDPFRAERKPSAVAYSPIPVEQSAPPPAPPRPQLSVSGIVWGPDPSAVIEGLPGMEGSKLMRTGESIAGITLRRILRERVELRGLDTTWSLQVRRPW